MKKLDCHIKIGPYVFTYVVELTVSTGIDRLTDTCVIEIPRKAEWNEKVIALGENGLLKTKYKVTVKTGYDGILQTAFKGYLKHIKPGTRVKLTCENDMYSLKQVVINKSYTSVTLEDLLEDIVPAGISFTAADITLGPIVIKNMSVAKVLEQLRSDFGIYSYFKDEVLYSGLAYWPDIAQAHHLKIGYNVIDDSGLEFIREEDVKLKVKAISIRKDNTRIEYETGDEDGDLRTLHFYDVDLETLKKLAASKMEELKYTGLSGSMEIFGEPFITKGDVVNITDENYPEKDGSYLVEAVSYKFGTRGYRQKITLGPKV